MQKRPTIIESAAFNSRYPHFYPQAEHPSFGHVRCNSVHNRDGDIFVNNHPIRAKKNTVIGIKTAE